jgi:hypothetical protein
MDLCTSIAEMKETSLKYSCFVLNGNRNGQFEKICCRFEGIAPCTRLYGSFIDFYRYESTFWWWNTEEDISLKPLFRSMSEKPGSSKSVTCSSI